MTFKLTAIVLATALGAVAANAQTTVITTETPAVIVQPESSTTVTTKERTGPLGLDSKTTTRTTTGSGFSTECSSKTVHKERALGPDTTVTKTDCP
ncbi:hypothetical protein [Undibacter mobilis]|uniref:Uncharacterized protein n=1 Tax=Undibacter mobilis TaxID=2292256 RepID=A0A371BAX7_9BRAD|nr:hypothetical protein [Undibacter mobilis]RDV04759.1 hypothetical protein DXH78_09400 [Undibacter mobilis]